MFFNQQLYGSGAFFNLYVSVDDNNSNIYSILVSALDCNLLLAYITVVAIAKDIYLNTAYGMETFMA